MRNKSPQYLTPNRFHTVLVCGRDNSCYANECFHKYIPGGFVRIALLVEAAERENATVIAASDNLSAQSVFYASSQDPLIGEELFAAGAYVGAGVTHEASLTVQDILRWLIIVAIIVGSLYKLAAGAF